MSGVNVEFYKAQVLKQLDVLDQRLLTNGPSRSPIHSTLNLFQPRPAMIVPKPCSPAPTSSSPSCPPRLCQDHPGEDTSTAIVSLQPTI